MAIGTPTQRKFLEAGGQTATTVFSPATTVEAGTVAFLLVTANANKVVSSVTDSVGNTWTVDATHSDGTRTLASVSCQVATQILSSDTITITWSTAASGSVKVWIQEVTGLAASSVFDKSATGSGTGTSLATSATAALEQADEIVWGVFKTNASGAGWTKGASYTNPTTPQSTTDVGSSLEYKIVSATTAVTADGSWSTSGTWVGLVTTYKMAAAAASVLPAAVSSGEAGGEPGARRKEVPEGVGTAETFGSEGARRRVGADGVPGEETFGQAGTLRREGATGVLSAEAAGEPAALRREGAVGAASSEAFGSETARRHVGPDSILAPGSYGEGGYGENPYGTQFGIPTVSAAAAAIVGDLLTETQVSDHALDTVVVVDGTLYAAGLYHADLDTVTVASADLDTVGVATSVLTAVSVADGLATDLDESASTAAIA